MKKATLLSLLVLTSLLFTACVPSPAATVSPATSTPMTEVPVETSVPSQSSEPPALEAARQALASQLGIDPSAVEINTYERAEWPDSCLGLYSGNEACAEVITPGYGGILIAEEQQYEFRTDESGSNVRFIPGAALSARQVLAQRLGVDLNAVRIVGVERTDWPDACLGIQVKDVMCAQVITPGYRVRLEAAGGQYEFHTDETGGDIRLAAAPEPRVGEGIVAWEGQDGVCESLTVGDEGIAFGLCGAPQISGRYATEQRLEELDYFWTTYASFTADTRAGKLTFTGQGDRQPAPAEQRAIAEWARLVYVEAVGGRSGASYGLALAWHREGGIAGFCDDLEIYLTGSAFATSCKVAQPGQGDRFRLDARQLQQLYDWIDNLKSFEVNQTDPATADAMTIRLVFSGMGEVEAGEAERAAIQEFAPEVYASRGGQGTPSAGQETPSPDLEAARQALLAYFTALNAGRFEEAAGYYGGSYEILLGYNPDVPPEDHEALLDAACRYNGFQCLKIREIVEADQVSPDEFIFTVQFANPDGSQFQRRPCCGVDSPQTLPESEFTYTVVKSDGKFLVQELPVYVP